MANNSTRKTPWYKSPKIVRHGVMLFFFLFLSHVAIEHQFVDIGQIGPVRRNRRLQPRDPRLGRHPAARRLENRHPHDQRPTTSNSRR